MEGNGRRVKAIEGDGRRAKAMEGDGWRVAHEKKAALLALKGRKKDW